MPDISDSQACTFLVTLQVVCRGIRLMCRVGGSGFGACRAVWLIGVKDSGLTPGQLSTLAASHTCSFKHLGLGEHYDDTLFQGGGLWGKPKASSAEPS